MAGIKAAIADILNKLSTITVTNQDGQNVPLFTRVWNNQIQYNADGQMEVFPMPAAFVEVVSPASYEIIGQGYRNSDISFRIHLVHEFYNGEGTFEQDLIIFDLRDSVIKAVSFYTPAGCGPLMCMSESQQYDHKNIYEYVIDFVANFTDDTAKKVYIDSVPPTALEQVSTIQKAGGNINQGEFLIPKQTI